MKRLFIIRAVHSSIVSSLVAQTTESKVDPRLHGSYRFEQNRWIYIHAEGPPEQLGAIKRETGQVQFELDLSRLMPRLLTPKRS